MSADDSAVAACLERAAACRFLSLLFRPPERNLADEASRLAPLLPPASRPAAAALAAEDPAMLEHTYHALLGASGACPDCETDYEVNPLGGKGPLLADVAGFHRAFCYDAPTEFHLQPDHIAMEMDFLAYLATKTALALSGGDAGSAATCQRAANTFWADHLGRWAPEFLARLAAAAGDTHHGRAAALAAELLPPAATMLTS